MEKILIAVDNFSGQHIQLISDAVRAYGSVQRLVQSSDPEVFKAAMSDAIAMVGWPEPDWLKGTALRLLQIGSSGWDAYENAGVGDKGIRLCTGKGIYSIGVAEHCIAMMMYFTRNFRIHIEDQQRHVFRRHEPYGEVAGSTACIVGLGDIGMHLARRCKGLGMKTFGVDVHDVFDDDCIDRYFSTAEIKLAVSQADHVFATLPGGASTRNFFNSTVLTAFRKQTYFYNVSRGSTVDQDCLYSMLASRQIQGAGLDVAEEEPLAANSRWWNLDNVLITGHSAGLSARWPDRFCDLALRNLAAFFEGRPLINEIVFDQQQRP